LGINTKHRFMTKTFILIGIVFACLSVVIGAFGAHALKNLLIQNQKQDIFETAVRYQFFHALAIICTGMLSYQFKVSLHLASSSFLIGILVFSGSLYILSITNIKWLGAITPIGGVAFIFGWLVLFWEVMKMKI
jgi:uncharacterized membrane protein YgdD (TMEM256/DUF423 family)